MRTQITSNHFTDDEGNPAGGSTYGVGFAIAWQNGPLSYDGERHEPNGAFVENVLLAVIDRLEFYQSSKFNCKQNAEALTALYDALAYLEIRTEERVARGVEGTNQI